MQKKQLVQIVAERTKTTRKIAESVLDATLNEITAQISGGDAVTIRGFGTFKSIVRAGKVGRNIRTGEEITIPARKSPVIKWAKEMRDKIK